MDNEGATEIVVIAGGTRSANGTLRVFESGLKPWIPSRPAWNQQQYFNVNINDNLTVPQSQQAHHLTGGEEKLNIFLAQYSNANFPVPDATVDFDSTYCSGDSLIVQFTICNYGSNVLPAETPVIIYDDNPETVNANPILTFELGAEIEVDTCLSFSKKIKVDFQGTFYILVTSDNTPPPPYNLANDFPITNIKECNYTNNIIGFPVVPTSTVFIELPPDTILCPNEIFSIKAISNAANYRWQDGSTDSTLTIFEEGKFWCCVSNDCGLVLCDSIEIRYDVSKNIDLGQDKVICEGENLTINAITGATDKIRWYPINEVACDTCANNLVEPKTKTTYVVVSESDAGCITVDSVIVDVFPVFTFYDTIQFCLGDTVKIEGFEVTRSGTVEIAGQTVNGCDSTYYYELVEAIDTIFETSVESICDGDTILVFGNFVYKTGIFTSIDNSSTCVKIDTVEVRVNQVPETFDTLTTCLGKPVKVFDFETDRGATFVENYTRSGSCDSIHSITLISKDTFFNYSQIEICQNEKADIFGASVGFPGIFSKIYVAQNGCDSTSVLDLVVWDTLTTSDSLVICSGDSALIFGEYQTEENIYAEVFQSQESCDSTHSIKLQLLPSLTYQPKTTTSCFGDDSGSGTIEILDGSPPFDYLWENGSTDSLRTNLEAGSYYFTITDNNGCPKIDSILIQNETFEIDAELIPPVCSGAFDGSIEITTNNPELEFGLDGVNFSNQTIFDSLSAGDYSVFVRNADGCSSETNFKIDQPDPIWVALQGDTLINLGDSIYLTPNSNIQPQSYFWTPEPFVDCNNCPSVIARPTSQTLFSVLITDDAGCMATDSVLIRVKSDRKYYAPSAFSPNDDGINDFFNIYGDPTLSEIETLKIFDRWGNFIWEGNNLTPNANNEGWDGRFRGKKLNSAVFAYFGVLKFIDGKTITVKGDISLLK